MTESMTDARLAEIEARADAAPKGPWDPIYETCDCGGDYGCSHGAYVYALHTPEPSVERKPDEEPWPSDFDRDDIVAFGVAGAEFIGAARTDVPELVTEVRRLRSLLDGDLESTEAEVARLREENARLRNPSAWTATWWTTGDGNLSPVQLVDGDFVQLDAGVGQFVLTHPDVPGGWRRD